MINCVVTFWVDCSTQEYNSECHISLYLEFAANIYELDVEELLCENGWLYLNEEEAYCPVCRKQLHGDVEDDVPKENKIKE